MELVYLWVDSYKNIQNQGFNFSPRFTCRYDKGTKELTIDEKKEHVSIFPKNINVTAIVGENGSGKSNLLNLLYSGVSPSSAYFYIFDLGKELIVKGINILEQPSDIITNNKIKKVLFENKKTITLKCDSIEGNLKLNINNLSFVYFSTFFEPIQNIETKCIIGNSDTDKFNFSTSHLINYYANREFERNNNNHHFISYSNQYQLYKNKNIQNTISMLKNNMIKLPILTPTKIYLRINNSNLNKFFYIEKLEYLSQEFFNNQTEVPLEDLSFIEKVKKSILINFLDYSLNTFPFKDKLLEQIYITDKKSIDNIFQAFYDVFSKEHLHDGAQINPYIQDFQSAKKLVLFIEEYEEIHGHIVLDIANISDEFIEIYQKLVLVGLDFLHFEWFPNLSTGQENLLFQFANFYSLTLDRISNRKLKDNVFIFIDEGENTLHPNWQKYYVKYLIEFFSKNFPQKINLIFSSHSPFILSDLPKENVIFLEKDEVTGNCKNVTSTTNIETFGANIHTLLSHGFFMKDGLMGEFAKEKINEAIKYLNQKTLTKEQIDYCENIISIIGEPILKRQLQKMLDSKRLIKIDDIDQKIRDMEYELSILKKHQNKATNDELKDRAKRKYSKKKIDDKN
jgi:energy-coupling factor transporter ATP-binding protein EcfA2